MDLVLDTQSQIIACLLTDCPAQHVTSVWLTMLQESSSRRDVRKGTMLCQVNQNDCNHCFVRSSVQSRSIATFVLREDFRSNSRLDQNQGIFSTSGDGSFDNLKYRFT